MPSLDIAIIDGASGRLIVEDSGPLAGATLRQELDAMLGPGTDFGCARPAREVRQLPATTGPGARIAGYWHDSFIEGPGRRSVVQFQGCSMQPKCAGCWVPETWDFGAGTVVAIDVLADALLDAEHGRDGVTILGGEPFAQPAALLALVGELLGRGCAHITVYSGYTLEALQARAQRDPDVAGVLASINVLIDGRYASRRAHRADCACDAETVAWSGSCNQRITTFR